MKAPVLVNGPERKLPIGAAPIMHIESVGEVSIIDFSLWTHSYNRRLQVALTANRHVVSAANLTEFDLEFEGRFLPRLGQAH